MTREIWTSSTPAGLTYIRDAAGSIVGVEYEVLKRRCFMTRPSLRQRVRFRMATKHHD